jgi:hypothetical protein
MNLVYSLLVVLFLFATRPIFSFYGAKDWVSADDVNSYLVMAKAAPSFPKERIAFHFAQRIIPHYTVGMLSHLSGLSVEQSYEICNFLLVSAIVLLSSMLFQVTSGDIFLSFFLVSLALISPYSLRLNVLVAGLMADLVFILGLLISLLGIEKKSKLAILAGLLIATSGKQMSLLVLPGILVLTYDSFRETSNKRSLLAFCVALFVATYGFYKFLGMITADFWIPNFITGNVLFAFFPWLFSSEFSIAQLADHLFRIIIPILPFIFVGMFFFSKNWRKLVNAKSLGYLLIVLGPIAYAFLPGPLIQQANQSRYVGSILIPLALLLKLLIDGKGMQWSKLEKIFLVGILALFSYHYKFSIPASSVKIFLVVHFSTLFVLLIYFRIKSTQLINT